MKKLLALLALSAAAAQAYYHFTHYISRQGISIAVVERFDLAALNNKSVPYFISEQGPTILAAGDSFNAVVSQIRAAANVWNTVPSAEIKLAFGGMMPAGQAMNSPHIEVSFTDELAPGVWGLGGPSTKLDMVTPTTGNPFIPIAKSVLLLPNNLSARASSSEQFFLTAVHEFGHTLGLQHTWTSGVMSTEQTRATSKAAPLGADDIAGLSLLYPTKTFLASMGSITGKVTMSGVGVHLASVVALAPNRQAVSALTQPDGSFRIDGLEAGSYMVYAQPLPPYPAGGALQPADLVLPDDGTGNRLLPSGYFDVAFYPGTAQPQQSVTVASGLTTDSVNFNVRQRAGVNLFDVATYSYVYSVPGTPSIKPATLLAANGISRTVMSAAGFPSSGAGLTIGLLGSSETVSAITPYTSSFLIVDFSMNLQSPAGPRHLLYTYNGQSYVQPSAVRVMQKKPPLIASIVANADHTLTVTGSGFNAATRVQLDGVDGLVTFVSETQLSVVPPPAPAGYKAAVAAFNADGQSSLFYNTVAPPVYTYDTPAAPRVDVSTTNLTIGSEGLIELTGTATDFTTWSPTFALGSSDVVVKQVWPMSATHAIAQVAVSAQAVGAPVSMMTGTGLSMTNVSGGFQLLPGLTKPYFAVSSLPRGSFYPSGVVLVPIGNAPANGSTVTVSLTGKDGVEHPASVLSYQNNQALVAVPAGLASGGCVLRGTIDGQTIQPAAIQMDTVPPAVIMLLSPSVVRAGEPVQLIVAGLSDSGASVQTSRLRITGAGFEHTVQSTSPYAAMPGTQIVQFSLSPATPTGQPLSIVLSLDDVPSQPFTLNVQ